ncbi:MAG: sodium:solute symporter family protein [Alphaproteobacteria bacterium]|nr:sodium:solute symporter family protein [Alphaproteobacteria bacterium]OJV12081.1 MAG: hypothetical protein BGO27_04995 [Alphaproteobacteria bacterium 33-17]
MLDSIIVGLYLLIALAVGVIASKFVKSDDDYNTGGKNYSGIMIFATLSASFLGGGFTIGLAEKTYTYGIVFILAIWGFSLKEILIAKLIAPRMENFQKDCVTVGDIMEKGYGKNAKIISGIASILCCGGIIGAQVAACGNILHILMDIPPQVGSLIAASIVVAYASVGGLKSVVIVDVLHFCVLIIMVPVILFFGLNYVGGATNLFESMPTYKLLPFGEIGLFSFAILFASFFLGETLVPPYVQRLLIGKNSLETEKGTVYSGLMSIIFFTVIGVIGMIASNIAPEIESKFALPYVINNVMPIGLKGCAVAAMLAIIMSSADAFLNATSIGVKNDLLKPLGLSKVANISDLNLSRLITLLIGAVAIAFALTTSSVIDILLYSYQFWTPFILIPLVAVIFGFKSSQKAFLFSAMVGIITLVAWNIFEPFSIGIDGALEGVIFGVIMNSLAFYGFSYMLPKDAKMLAI